MCKCALATFMLGNSITVIENISDVGEDANKDDTDVSFLLYEIAKLPFAPFC